MQRGSVYFLRISLSLAFLESEESSESNNRGKYILSKERIINTERDDISTNAAKNPSTDDISWIMHSSDDSRCCCQKSKKYYPKNQNFPRTKLDHSNQKCCHEQCVSRRKRIIEGMGNQRRNPSYDILRARSPFIDPKVDSGIY